MEGTPSLLICQICEIAQAKLECKICKIIKFFCDPCFPEFHALKKMKDHPPIPIEFKTMCNVDKTKEAEYYCSKCQFFFCDGCKQSKFHDQHSPLSKAQIKEMLDNNCDEFLQMLGKVLSEISKLIESCKTRKNEFVIQFEAMNNEVTKAGHEVCSEVNQKTSIIRHKIDMEKEENFLDLNSLLNKLFDYLKSLEPKKDLVSAFKSKTDNLLLAWATLHTERNLLTELANEISNLAKMDVINPEKAIRFPKVNLKPILKSIKNMSFAPEESEKYTKKNAIILFQQEYSQNNEIHPLPFEIRLLSYIEKKDFEIGIKVAGTDGNGYASNIPSCFRDLLTKKFYTSIGNTICYELKEYIDTEGYFKGFPSKSIRIPSGFNGTYLIANNNCIFANIYNSNKIGKFSLENNSVEELVITDALFNGNAPLNSGGHQDISLLQDEATNSFYVYYQIKDQLKSILSLISLFPKMEIKRSWEIPLQKNQISFCFIYDNLFYLGFKNVKHYISMAYDLIGECIRIIPEIVLPSTGIHSINYFANLEMIIIGENGQIKKLIGTTK